jgi:eukaryotic-like serine/threonine-protein kinase
MSHESIGRYRVEAEIGRGGMGVVYRAIDPELERPVAVKLIRLPPDSSLELREELEKRFRREAKAAARIRHPGVVVIHDVGTTATGLFLVMELVDGESLASRLERGHFPPRDSALELAARAAEALAAAHQAGVVHRDVKPANILLSRDGRVMLTDFGVARSLDEVSELTRTGMVVGSPAYMAPEQLQGAAVDGRADLFSLGVVLYELLLRKRPFPAQSITTLLYQILHEDPLADPALHRELDPPLSSVLRRLLAKQPAERFADAGEAALALRASIGFADQRSEAPTLPRLTMAATPLAAAATPPGHFTPPPPGAPTPPGLFAAPSPQAMATTGGVPSRGGRPLLWVALAALVVLVVGLGALIAWREGNPPRPTLAGGGPAAGWDPAASALPEPSYAVTGTPAPLPSPTATIATVQVPPALPAATLAPVAEPPRGVYQPPVYAENEPARPEPEPQPEPEPEPAAPAPPPPPPEPAIPVIPEDLRFSAQRGFELEVDPEEAEVWVDGRSYGAAERWDGRPALELGPGRHLVRLTHPEYHPMVIELRVSPEADDELAEVEVELDEL